MENARARMGNRVRKSNDVVALIGMLGCGWTAASSVEAAWQVRRSRR